MYHKRSTVFQAKDVNFNVTLGHVLANDLVPVLGGRGFSFRL